MENSPKRYHRSCAISANTEAASSIRRRSGRYLKTNAENVEVGKRVAEYNAPTEVVVEFSVHGSLQVQYTTPIVWVWCFDRKFCSRRAIHKNLDP